MLKLVCLCSLLFSGALFSAVKKSDSVYLKVEDHLFFKSEMVSIIAASNDFKAVVPNSYLMRVFDPLKIDLSKPASVEAVLLLKTLYFLERTIKDDSTKLDLQKSIAKYNIKSGDGRWHLKLERIDEFFKNRFFNGVSEEEGRASMRSFLLTIDQQLKHQVYN